MKKTILLITLLVIATSTLIFAGQKNLYQGGDFTGPPNFLPVDTAAYYKDGTTPCVAGTLIQGVAEVNTSTIYPPITNDQHSSYGWYVQSPQNGRGTYNDGRLPNNDPHPQQDANAGSVGSVNGLGGSTSTAGNYKMAVGGANNDMGWLRVFSSTHWTNSVYYGDGTQWAMPGSPDYDYAGAIVSSNINPSYMIQFSYVPTGSEGSISGTVANVGSGNNQISNTFLEIDYKLTTESNDQWKTNETVNASGAFEITGLSATSYDVRVRVKNANTPRDGFPISASHEVTVTGPAPKPFINITNPLFDITVTNVTTYTISGTNNHGVFGIMNWESSISSNGILSATSTWEIVGIPLIIGENILMVTGSNIVGVTTNDTVTITNLPEPSTFIILVIYFILPIFRKK